ncbi:hypothetical protein J6590_023092 [Homalodisca vitripennis]|nr:hypothetical protein J6590_023092 [Homalodisca vitripennis]
MREVGGYREGCRKPDLVAKDPVTRNIEYLGRAHRSLSESVVFPRLHCLEADEAALAEKASTCQRDYSMNQLSLRAFERSPWNSNTANHNKPQTGNGTELPANTSLWEPRNAYF